MNAVEIEEAIEALVAAPFDREEFPFQFLESFGNKPTTIKRLRKGSSNRTDIDGAVLQRSNIHILPCEAGEVEAALAALRDSPKTAQQKAKFILATDGNELQAEDLSSGEVLACAYTDLPKHFGFLLPLAGISTVKEIKNNPIDIKATSRLDKLYVALLSDERNKDWANEKNRERFNHFMAQLIFCFFAEDTGIFRSSNLFTATVGQMSDADASNTQEIIYNIFDAMNRDPRVDGARDGVRPYADVFPYVNGGLFGGALEVPAFTKMARTYLLRAGDLDWTAINPDIFGSMIQAVADDEERGALGMHYTSVPNILKVLNPLFLDSLNEDLEKAGNNKQQLGKLKKRISRIRVFDPACGSGNFLVIAYKKMREIEHKANIAGGWAEQIITDNGEERWISHDPSVIPLTNFRGIEIKSFAAEIARLALIIAEYQSNQLYLRPQMAEILFLPLDKTNWITRGNALRLDWLSICPPTGETRVKVQNWQLDLTGGQGKQSEIDFANEGGETYICGNPPYVGNTKQSKAQKSDLQDLFGSSIKRWKSLDYVAGWFWKCFQYIKTEEAKAGIVSTNSICQGEQVPALWPTLFQNGIEIPFAVRSFKWRNLASSNAGVTVVIIGLSRTNNNPKQILDEDEAGNSTQRTVSVIGPYLQVGNTVSVRKTSVVPDDRTLMVRGNLPNDGGHLLLDEADKSDFTLLGWKNFVRRFVGSRELINGASRRCLWIKDSEVLEAQKDLEILRRVSAVKAKRCLPTAGTQAKSVRDLPHRFAFISHEDKPTLVVPRVSSEHRDYLPVDLTDGRAIIGDRNFALYDAPLWNMALIASRLHWVWIGTVCVRMRTDFSYSNTLGWNTFPVPTLTAKNKADLTRAAENILLAREAHFPATIADLYKPTKRRGATEGSDGEIIEGMPENLRAAHDENDRILEEIYIGRRFKNDTERLEKLFEMYTEMTGGGNE